MDSSTTGENSSGAELYCQTCLTTFETRQAKRAHMKTDWHVYNLKRRLASLPPISEVAFHQQEPPSDVENNEAEPFEGSCLTCEQLYTNRKRWEAHLRSRSHLQRATESVPGEDPSTTVEEQFIPSHCLFCNVDSTSLDSNLAHMSLTHSFFVPDIEDLIDLESFLGYLFAIVAVFHECLFCGGLRRNKFAAQDHMRGKGHCRIDLKDDVHQLKQFYEPPAEFNDEEDGYEGLINEAILLPGEDELRLPSGKILSHRSRARYFRQPLSHHPMASAPQEQAPIGAGPEPPPIVESQDRRIVMRAGTSTSLVGVSDLQKRALMAVERKQLKIESIARNEYRFKLERGGNRQKRYKVASMGKKQGGH